MAERLWGMNSVPIVVGQEFPVLVLPSNIFDLHGIKVAVGYEPARIFANQRLRSGDEAKYLSGLTLDYLVGGERVTSKVFDRGWLFQTAIETLKQDRPFVYPTFHRLTENAGVFGRLLWGVSMVFNPIAA